MYLVARGSGYPVLFIHGIPTSSQLWTGVVDRLARRFACHAVDLPGLGKTPKAAHGLNQLAVLAESLERIRVEQKIWAPSVCWRRGKGHRQRSAWKLWRCRRW